MDWTDINAVKQHLQSQEKTLDPQSPELATILSRLADLYFVEAGYREAEPLYWRALEIRQKSLGEAHEDTAASLKNLAELYEIQDRYAEAERFYQWSALAKKQAHLVKHSNRMDMTMQLPCDSSIPNAEKMRQALCQLCQRPLLDSIACMYCTQRGFDAVSLIAKANAAEPEPVKSGPAAVINALVNTATSQTFQLEDTEVSIGRHPSNKIVLSNDKFASRYHALVKFKKGYFWVEDRNTANGTFLNSVRLEAATQLSPDDTITVGQTTLRAIFED